MPPPPPPLPGLPPRFRPEAPTRAAKESAEGGAGTRPLGHARTPTNKLIEPKAEAKEQEKEDKICEEPQKGARERSHWINRIVRGSVAARYYLVASKSSAHFGILALTFFDDIPRL